jgi:predicted nucleotide-binding protein
MAKKKVARRDGIAQPRVYLSQADVPAYSLEQALRVPTAICESYGGNPVTPLRLAEAMLMQPTSGPFRSLCGASIAYGLTQGGCNAQSVTLEPLGKRIMRPTEEGEDLIARRQAILRPRVVREFLERYDGSSLPRADVAINVLADLGVPREKAQAVFDLILENAQSVGLLRTIKDRLYVDLAGLAIPNGNGDSSADEKEGIRFRAEEFTVADRHDTESTPIQTGPAVGHRLEENSPSVPNSIVKRVYITHGKNRAFIEPIKKLLGFGELVPIVSVETQSVAKPVPQKVMDEMRGCGAAIIHVEPESEDPEQDGPSRINSNVLIEIGAAMALFGNRFILLVRNGVTLPSNLQGLFVERYEGPTLDAEVTIRLFEAINSMKNTPLPKRYSDAGNDR